MGIFLNHDSMTVNNQFNYENDSFLNLSSITFNENYMSHVAVRHGTALDGGNIMIYYLNTHISTYEERINFKI